jgi:predicted metal-dependent phosphoesterase TrpH
MLGYFLEREGEALTAMLSRIRGGRDERNRAILARLVAMGMPLEWEEVSRLSEQGVVGRPHFARAMVERGYVDTTSRAFNRYLGKGRAAYCERYRPGAREAIEAITASSGVAVMAHPLTLDMKFRKLSRVVSELKEYGLQGIEAVYPEHTRDHAKLYLELAAELDLVATGGSDFHGATNPAIKLGRGFGQLAVPADCVEALEARRV